MFPTKNYEACSKTVKYDTRYQEKKQTTETACESNKMLDFTEKNFKIAPINMFRELKKSMRKE